MKYEVVWTDRASNDLAEIWMKAEDPDVVRIASEFLDRSLSVDPLRFGQAWHSSVHRAGFRTPLGVEFEVIEDDKRVLVHGVWSIP